MSKSDAFALGALVLSVATAFYTYVLGRRTLRVTTFQGATALALQWDQVFIEYPLLRPYFYDDEPVPAIEADPAMHHRVLAATELAVDIAECIWDHREDFKDDDREAWKDWIHAVFLGSPSIRTWYAENVKWYPALRKMAAEAPNEERGVPHIVV